MIKNILFDLDGTLTDPKEGITKSIQHVFETFSLPAPEADDLLWCIGPSIVESMKKLLPVGYDINQAVQIYRERYKAIGMLENSLYPGITELLTELKSSGFKLFVATAKPTVFANPILEHFQLKELFSGVYGSELDGNFSNKKDLLKLILKNENLVQNETLMIGDRSYDIIGAKHNDLAYSVGVLWGYGSEEELRLNGSDFIIQSIDQLKMIVKLIKVAN